MEKDPGATLAWLQTLEANHPDSLKGSSYDIEQIARGVFEHGRTDAAISLFRFNVEMFAGDAAVHSALARAFELSGKVDSSKTHALRALAIDSLNTRALELGRRLGLAVPR